MKRRRRKGVVLVEGILDRTYKLINLILLKWLEGLRSGTCIFEQHYTSLSALRFDIHSFSRGKLMAWLSRYRKQIDGYCETTIRS